MDPDKDVRWDPNVLTYRPQQPVALKAIFSRLAPNPATARQSGMTIVSRPDGQLATFSLAALPYQVHPIPSSYSDGRQAAWTGKRKDTHNNTTGYTSSPISNRSAVTVPDSHVPPPDSINSEGIQLGNMVVSGLPGYGPANRAPLP